MRKEIAPTSGLMGLSGLVSIVLGVIPPGPSAPVRRPRGDRLGAGLVMRLFASGVPRLEGRGNLPQAGSRAEARGAWIRMGRRERPPTL